MLDYAFPAAEQDYPLLNLFWTMFWFFLWALWLFLLIRVTIDIFRSHDLNGWGKAGWLAFVIVLPYLGVLVYLITRGAKMNQREVMDVQTSYGTVRGAPQPTSGAFAADELTKLAALRDHGDITDAEFASQKAAILK